MCRLSWNLGTSASWNPLGLFRPVMGSLYQCAIGIQFCTSTFLFFKGLGMEMVSFGRASEPLRRTITTHTQNWLGATYPSPWLPYVRNCVCVTMRVPAVMPLPPTSFTECVDTDRPWNEEFLLYQDRHSNVWRRNGLPVYFTVYFFVRYEFSEFNNLQILYRYVSTATNLQWVLSPSKYCWFCYARKETFYQIILCKPLNNHVVLLWTS